MIKYILGACLIAAISGATLGAETDALTRLRGKYQGLTSFHAKVEQTKTSPLLLRPLKTAVRIEFAHDRLSWIAEGQSPLIVSFPKSGLPTFDAGTSLPIEMPVATRTKLLETLSSIRDLMTMSPRIDERFELKYLGDILTVTPKVGSSEVFFRSIQLHFDADQELKEMILQAADDETQLKFLSFKIEK